jgi:parvulin-like peptidyl-prolyl isomerase
MARTTPPRASKSATVRAAAAAPSRRQRSKWARERQQTRLLILAGGVLALIMGLILAAGWVIDNVVRPNDPVAEVAGQAITANRLVDAMRPQAQAIDAQVRRAGGANAQSVDQQKRSLPDQTLTTLVQQTIIEQEAARRGISVSADDVEQQLQQTIAQQDAASRPPPTPAPAASPTPTGAVAGTPTPLPTLEPDAFAAGLQQLLTRTGLSEAQLRDQLRQGLLADRVQAAIGAEQVPASQEQVHARHILLKTQDEANGVLQQLQGGADFAQLAGSVSVDPGSKDKGGDLGWFPRGVMNKPFEDAAFALHPGQLSDVVQSPDGYHVIQVLERDPDRAVDPSQLQSLRQQAFSTWLEGKRTGPDVKLELSDADRAWALARIGVRP